MLMQEPDRWLVSTLERFGHDVSLLFLPGKIVYTLISWGSLMPLPSDALAAMATRQKALKAVNSTFELPKFLAKQIKLYEAYADYQDARACCREFGYDLAIKTKNVFCAFLEVTLSALKIPLLFNKTHLIDLSKISTRLPTSLSYGTTVLSLGVSGIKFSDSAWELGVLVKEGQPKDIKNFSQKKIRSIAKVASNSIKLASSGLSAGVLFMGWCISPLFLVSVSTISFAVSLVNKIYHQNSLLRAGSKSNFITGSESLPA